MHYITVKRASAVDYGFRTMAHLCKEETVLLNEKEIQDNQILQGTLEERVTKIDGTMYSETEVFNKLNEGGWHYEL